MSMYNLSDVMMMIGNKVLHNILYIHWKYLEIEHAEVHIYICMTVTYNARHAFNCSSFEIPLFKGRVFLLNEI